jgi:L-lactate dehydrogenase complex protein LldG
MASPAAVRLSAEECVSRFAVEAAALGIECYLEDSADNVRTRLSALVGTLRVISWDPEHLPYESARVLNTPGAAMPRAEQAAAEVGVTGCDAAVAETASVVLFSAAGRSRLVSLLPPCHVSIVQRQQLCLSMAEVLARFRDRFERAASCTFITGPSRTADIELTLTLGIHGPARVAVIIGP